MKQDRTAPRNASDIEQKYSFGKKFSEILGLIDDSRKDVDSTASELRNEIAEQATSIRRDMESIVADVTQTVRKEMEDSVSELTSKVEAKMTSEEVTIAIQTELANSVDRVHTRTGFTFDDEGLTVERSGTEMKTQITEDGMQVFHSGSPVLTANSKGVNAKDLHASSYLIVGEGKGRSRFEDYGARTGCFWCGG